MKEKHPSSTSDRYASFVFQKDGSPKDRLPIFVFTHCFWRQFNSDADGLEHALLAG
ncbi:hypothetical protein QWV57_16865 [Geobacillus zalihae]|uniref:hypothetical protein n=1 Tax=Geobacillus zalihae TaxID=213419 RepID=UPI00261319AB|nr:hypothetical protein [Geobacillus zalihae]WKA47285.1 hypothetical protein QWV57_16865 [Geobacillus zalihae]